MQKRRIAVALAVVAGLAGSTVVASPAHAASFYMATDDDNPGAGVYFDPYGDVVSLYDHQDDGWNAYVRVWDVTQDLYKYAVTDPDDVEGSQTERRASMGGPYDLREGNQFEFKVCLIRDGQLAFCDYAVWRNNN